MRGWVHWGAYQEATVLSCESGSYTVRFSSDAVVRRVVACEICAAVPLVGMRVPVGHVVLVPRDQSAYCLLYTSPSPRDA